MKNSAMPKSKAKTAYDLLSEVRRLILEEPLRYDQNWWLARRGATTNFAEPNKYPSCGTVGCVAGWVATLKKKRVNGFAAADVATRVLGLNHDEALELFDAGAAGGPPQTRAHAKAGAAHIARFQKQYAKQLKATAV